ncbi:MAG: holo-ACP synthase [Solirubrobacteraceae bacterium]
MCLGVGIDLTSADDVRDSIGRFGDRYLERVYTARERSDCDGDPSRLAARFAAKEATIKALRAPDRLPWQTIELRRGPAGAPALALTGAAQALARERGCRSLTVSLTHERGQAMAVVVTEGET